VEEARDERENVSANVSIIILNYEKVKKQFNNTLLELQKLLKLHLYFTLYV